MAATTAAKLKHTNDMARLDALGAVCQDLVNASNDYAQAMRQSKDFTASQRAYVESKLAMLNHIAKFKGA